MIDWLATRNGRLAAFFLLYVTEGLPLGYVATFVATLMRREGISPDVIGAFVASLYLPWSFKFLAGPFVDLFRSTRFGPRRAWIVVMQTLMTITLFVCAGLDIQNVTLFTAVVIASSIFGAVQDVAIDALAVDTLRASERGLANGLMFAGAAVGQAVGGSGALLLYKYGGLPISTGFVIACLVAVLGFVSLWLRERPDADAPSLLAADDVSGALQGYVGTAAWAFFGSWTGRLGVVFALMPAGGYALGLPLQSNLAVELGLSDDAIAGLNVASTIAFAVFCAVGGLISDFFGRVRSLMAFIALTAIPTLLFAWLLWKAGWIMPVGPNLPDRPTPPDWLVMTLWAASILFNMANGLTYGTRTAFYMDISDPKVAATQFTAYMALMNLVIAYTSYWQGKSIVAFGYPMTLVLDSAFGMLCLVILALVPLARSLDGKRDDRAPRG